MKRLLLVGLAVASTALLACAHTPQVEYVSSETAYAAITTADIRDAVRAELLAARPIPGVVPQTIAGAPTFLGVIDYTGTSTTNHQASTPFNNTGSALCGMVLLLQPSTDMYVLPVTTTTGTVTSANGVTLFANERVVLTMTDYFVTNATECWLAALRVTSSGNLRVWRLR
jgi:hypothetical protein